MRSLSLLAASKAPSFLLAALLACTAACSVTSSDEEVAPQEDGESETNEDAEQGSVSGESASQAASEPPAAPAPSAADPGAPVAPATPPAGPTITAPPGASCANLEGAVVESEGNDSAESANALGAELGKTTFLCGTLGADTDVDFVTFTLPADVKSFSYKLSYDATKPDVAVTVGARAPVALAGAVPLVKGEPYVLKVTGVAGTNYRIGIALK